MRNEMHAHTNCTTVVKIFSYVKLAYMLSIQPMKYIFVTSTYETCSGQGCTGVSIIPGLEYAWNGTGHGMENGMEW